MTTIRLDLPELIANQSQPHVPVNSALRRIDGLVNLTAQDRDLTSPPGSPSDGDVYIVGDAATGDWDGEDGNIAIYINTAWVFLAPGEGWGAWVVDEGKSYRYLSGTWDLQDFQPRVKNNLSANGAPTASDDSSEGYAPRSLWFDTASSPAEAYICVDATEGAAVWLPTTINAEDLGALAVKDTVATADIDDAAATNAKLANMAANTIKARLASSGAPQDVAIAANRLLARASTGDLEAKTLTDFALELLNDADAATMRTTLGLGSMSTQSASAVAITGGSIAGTTLNTQTADLETMIAQGL